MRFQAAFLPVFMLTALLATTACASKTHDHTASNGYPASVTHVHDGDTIRATDANGRNQRIRLANIDAPETSQAHGIASRDALRQMLNGQRINVEVVETDRYGRQVARITLNGKDINLAQLANGNAWHYRQYARRNQSPQEYQRYATAEAQAQQQRKGLWANKNPLAPWQYRQAQRGQGAGEKGE